MSGDYALESREHCKKISQTNGVNCIVNLLSEYVSGKHFFDESFDGIFQIEPYVSAAF